MRVPALRQEHDRAEEHRPAPELRQPIVLHAEVLHLRGVLRRRDRRNLLVHRDPDLAAVAGVDVHLHRLAVEVARLRVPVLSFALVHRHLDGVAVGAVERLVAVDQRLDEVVAGRDVLQAARRPADDLVVDDDVGAGLEAVDVDAEDRLRAVGAVLIRLRPRLRLAIVGDEQEDAAVERLRAAGGGKGNREAKRPGRLRARGEGAAARDRRATSANPRVNRRTMHRQLLAEILPPRQSEKTAESAEIAEQISRRSRELAVSSSYVYRRCQRMSTPSLEPTRLAQQAAPGVRWPCRRRSRRWSRRSM